MAPDIDVGTPAGVFVRSGIDEVSIGRVGRLLGEYDPSFRDRVFTSAERQYCENTRYPAQHYAARWAAKEAFVKVLDAAAPSRPLTAAQIGVVRTDDGPRLELEGDADAAFAETLVANDVSDPTRCDVSVSLTHDRDADVAAACVVVVGLTDERDRERKGGKARE
ncbi:holo-ACP synthase [Natronoglomus mannanivorans]|uniref:Holo-ACP synthase n=1 Tax=Natronoglomus mannanivorans TaxID=2979990 RepID=A0AAP2Z4G9_9EURY|nr:holo-ACP synthase [Halobacteria archaeon AArc-xg1-1]